MLDHSSVESINYFHYLRHWHFLQVSFQMAQLSKEIDSPGICRQSIPCALTEIWKVPVIVPQDGLLKQIRPIIFLHKGENADYRSKYKISFSTCNCTWNLLFGFGVKLSHTNGLILIYIREQGVEKNIWTWKRGRLRKVKKWGASLLVAMLFVKCWKFSSETTSTVGDTHPVACLGSA